MGNLNVDGHSANITLAIGPASGSAPEQEVTFSGSVTVQFDLQSGTNLQFVTRASSPEAIFVDELATDVWLLGDVVKARLRAWAVWQDWYPNGQDNVHVLAVTYKKLLQRRLVHEPLAFNDLDLGEIIWRLWEHTQSQPGGNLGVTPGERSTGLIRTRSYKEGENIGALAEADYDEGMWWMVDHNLVFTAGSTAAAPFLPTPLHLGANCGMMQRSAGSDFANAVFGDADKSRTTPVWREAANIATDPRGRWELAQGWPTVVLQDTLVNRTEAFLRSAGTPTAHWNLELVASRWMTDSRLMPGMFAVLVIPRSLAAPIGEPAPSIVVFVESVAVSFDEDGALEVKAVVRERPDVPVPTDAPLPMTPRVILG